MMAMHAPTSIKKRKTMHSIALEQPASTVARKLDFSKLGNVKLPSMVEEDKKNSERDLAVLLELY